MMYDLAYLPTYERLQTTLDDYSSNDVSDFKWIPLFFFFREGDHEETM